MYPTPYYIIDKDALDADIQNMKSALEQYWNHYIVGYSYKTNSLPWLIEYMKKQGFYAEVVSEDEYSLAEHIGTPKGQVIYNGPIKSKHSMLQAIKDGCIVNLDAQREIEWLGELSKEQTYAVGIRVNFDIEAKCPGQSACGDEGGRFGFCYENGELLKAIQRIQEKGVQVAGLHLHTSSKTRGIDIYKAIAQVACEIVQKYKLSFSYLDIGGGYFGGLDTRPKIKDYLAAVTPILSQCFDSRETALIIEPGMSLIGPNVRYVTSVIDTKDTTYGRFVVTDGSRTQIDPLMSKSNYFFSVQQNEENGKKLAMQRICGYTCMEHDRLFSLQDHAELSVGDKIVYDKVGAYTMCLTPLFIQYFPDVYVSADGKLTLVRKKWSADMYAQGTVEDVE